MPKPEGVHMGPETHFDPAFEQEVRLETGATQQMDALDLDDDENRDLSEFDLANIDVAAAEQARETFDTQSAMAEGESNLIADNNTKLEAIAAQERNKPLQDVGKERAAALAQKLSGGVKSLRGMFGGLGRKLADVGKGMLFGTLAAPEAAGRAASATYEAGVKAKDAAIRAKDLAAEKAAAAAAATKDAAVKGAKAAGKGAVIAGAAFAAPVVAAGYGAYRGGKAAVEGARIVGGKAVEAGKVVGKGAKDLGEIAYYGSLGAAVGAAEMGKAAYSKTVEGAKAAGQTAVEAGKVVGKGAKDLGEIALFGSIAAGQTAVEAGKAAYDKSVGAGKEALRLGNEHVVQPAIETATNAWNGLLERGRNMVDSLTEKKNRAVEGFWKKTLSFLEKGASKIDRAREGVEGKLQRIQAQRETLDMLDNVQPEPAAQEQGSEASAA